jgi:phage/plasmid-like protein (TIGR03299 family)
MAYVGEVPWHGLGNPLTEGASIDEWKVQSGTDWTALTTPVLFETENDELFYMEDKNVIYRSDDQTPIAVVSPNFKIVQPEDVLEFFRDITELGNFTMETAGVLFGGRRIWALARATRQASLGRDDKIKPYLFLATGLDGTLATTASFTTVRVVCNNTLQMAMRGEGKIRVTHRSEFKPDIVKSDLGLVDTKFDEFMDRAETLASISVTEKQTKDFYGNVFLGDKYDEDIQYLDSRVLDRVMFTHRTFPGQDTKSAKGTAWGLVNGVTAYLDHMKNTRTIDARLNDSWLGAGRTIKQKAVELALEL